MSSSDDSHEESRDGQLQNFLSLPRAFSFTEKEWVVWQERNMFRKHPISWLSGVAFVVATFFVLIMPTLSEAGCGCEKPPPVIAEIRPHVTYAGMPVTLFHPNLQPGQEYEVTFTSGITGESETEEATAVLRRDLADQQEKPQLEVRVPQLPLGPVSVSVAVEGETGALIALPDHMFTLAPQPYKVPKFGKSKDKKYRAAVSRDGVVYISLDMSKVQEPRVFMAYAKKYPLRFKSDDVVFYNTQGYLMQLLDAGIPGLFALEATDKKDDSDILQYSRHEFSTYFLQHEERQPHAVDPTDPNWHLNGSPHIDHTFLIVAIQGRLNDGSLPTPGETPKFELKVDTHSLFRDGLAGRDYIDISGHARIDAYKEDGKFVDDGEAWSNGTIFVDDHAKIEGTATGFGFTINHKGKIKKKKFASLPKELLAVDPPELLEDLGALLVNPGETVTLVTGSYRASRLFVAGQLLIDNVNGPVTLYVDGDVEIVGDGAISLFDEIPEKFAIYIQGVHDVRLEGNGIFFGVVYAPQSIIFIGGEGEFFGAFAGAEVLVSDDAQVHYDLTLKKGRKDKKSKKSKK